MMTGMSAGYLRQLLEAKGEEYQEVRANLEEVRAFLAQAIKAAAEAGVPQKDIIRLTGYTREAVRQIVKPEARERVNAARRKSPTRSADPIT